MVLPTRDRASFLGRAVRSVLAQTFPHWELVVVDDGSLDATPEILEQARRDDHRIAVIRQDTQGLTRALGRAIAVARGQYLARHDADDVSAPERLERQMGFLDAHPSAAAVGTATEVMDERGATGGVLTTPTGPAAVRRGLWTLRATPVHGSMMIRRTALETVGGYRPAFRYSQDYDLWLRMAERFDLDNLAEPLYRWRLNPAGIFATQRHLQLAYCALALTFARERRAHGGDSYESLAAAAGDLDAFAAGYRMRRRFRALLGELLLRNGVEPASARTHLAGAVAEGFLHPWTLAVLGWSLTGLRWPGRRTLAAPEAVR